MYILPALCRLLFCVYIWPVNWHLPSCVYFTCPLSFTFLCIFYLPFVVYFPVYILPVLCRLVYFTCPFSFTSPWYNLTGWLGVMHQLTTNCRLPVPCNLLSPVYFTCSLLFTWLCIFCLSILFTLLSIIYLSFSIYFLPYILPVLCNLLSCQCIFYLSTLLCIFYLSFAVDFLVSACSGDPVQLTGH